MLLSFFSECFPCCSQSTQLKRQAAFELAMKLRWLNTRIEGWVDVADSDKVFDTKPSHSHPPHPTTKPPTFSSLFILKLKPHPFCPFHNTTNPSPLHCVHATLPQPHIIWLLKKKERRGFEGSWKKRSGTFEWLFWSHTKPLNTSQQSSTHRDKEREKRKRLLRPYQEESTTSRLISEVKPVRAWLVLGLETTWEHQVS